MMERFHATIQNLTVAPSHLNSTKIIFESFVAGAVFVPPGQRGNILFWGGCQDLPAGVGLTGATDYPANAIELAAQQAGTVLGSTPANYAPILNVNGVQVALNVDGGQVGAYYPFPAECRPMGALKLTSSTVTSVAVVLKS